MKKVLFMSLTSLLLLLSATASPSNKLSNIKSWVCFYNSEFPANVQIYDLYIFDTTNHPAIGPLQAKGKKVVGYISVGEVAKHNDFFDKIKSEKLLVDENKNWPGSFRVNIKDEKWHKFVLKSLIPQITAKGFDGIFIDTIDTADYLENTKNIAGSVKGAADLIKKIRKKFPSLIIVLNNGLFLTEYVGNEIDALVVEDVYTLYNFKTKKYLLSNSTWTQERLALIKKFQEGFHKPVLSLDYLKPSDFKEIQNISNLAKSDGLIPYISDIELNQVFFHP